MEVDIWRIHDMEMRLSEAASMIRYWTERRSELARKILALKNTPPTATET